MNSLVEKILSCDKLAIAKAISLVENESNESSELLKLIYKNTGKAYLIGITGPPGAGKSTITNSLTKLLRQKNFSVGIIAVDPTSPFTGGAVLGDRIRMQEVAMDDGVFIRSMATRGSLGGLAKKAKEASEILDAAGKDFIIIETVGVGQSELDVAKIADTTVVVLVPESGDSVQTMKAGLMEIGDIFVVNKCDRPGSDTLASALRTMLHLKMKSEKDWEPAVTKTIASQNAGIDQLLEDILRHKFYLQSDDRLSVKRREHLVNQIYELAGSKLQSAFWSDEKRQQLDKNLRKIIQRELSPYDLVEDLFKMSY